MAIYATTETTYELPPVGLHPAVCVDVVDEGFKSTQFGEKHKVRFVFQIEEQNSKGYRYTVSAWFNLSMHENASMRQFLEQWRGRPFGEKELQPPGFDLETVVGKPATINIVHNDSNGKTYANIGSIAQHTAKFGEPLQPDNYVRAEDREDAKAAGASTGTNGSGASTGQQHVQPDIEEEEVPF